MENKNVSLRWRPKKDFWELKSKLAQEAIENKWKLWRWRPKKQRSIDDSINTKISNHRKDIAVLEKNNENIHKNIKINKISENTESLLSEDKKQREEKAQYYSKVALVFSIAFFFLAILFFIINKKSSYQKLNFQEINSTWDENIVNTVQEDESIQLEIWYTDNSWDFIAFESIDINSENNVYENNNEDISLINSFYDSINNRKFSELSNITDSYLKKSDSYKTYFSSNWLSNFLDKIAWNKIFVGKITELPSDKPNVKHYSYIVKYKLNNESTFRQEDREIAIVERNWERLIWSIMCVTTWCSRMPFFQK